MQKVVLNWILILSCYFPFILQAQSNTNSLLWRITGNGLAKPSYLYGTIHLNDKRVFKLGDSLYSAISGTDGFAMELDPNAISLMVIDEIKKGLKDKKTLKNILSNQDYAKYGPRLEKKLNKPKDSITAGDIVKEKNRWIKDAYKTGEMETFLDAYLVDIARRQGKWTGGVEDIEDQEGLLEDVIDKTDIVQILAMEKGAKSDQLKKLIEAYENQDLGLITRLSDGEDSLSFDRIVIRRNRKMAYRMDSLARVRSMVFAVGAAHLPGNEGVIELLKREGFIVEPVFSSRRISPSEYVVKEVPLQWEPVKDEMGFYEASMPGKAANLKYFELVNMKVYVDIFHSNSYFTAAISSPFAGNKLDSITEALAGIIFKNVTQKTGEAIEMNGASGKLYKVTDDDGFREGFILRRHNIIYIAVVANSKAVPTSTKDLDRFLSSFKVLDPNSIGSKKGGYLFSDSLKGYRVVFPEKPKLVSEMAAKKTSDGHKSELYIATDGETGSYYFFGVNTLAPGNFIENDSSYLLNLESTMNGQGVELTWDSMYVKDGNRAMRVEGKLKQNGMWMSTRYYLRGNRWYGLVAMFDSLRAYRASEDYFRSFSMTEYPARNWSVHASPDSLFTIRFPEKPTILGKVVVDKEDEIQYNVYDSVQALGCDVIGSALPKYFWINSDSAFWARIGKNKILKDDSLVLKRQVTNGDVPGLEIIKCKKNCYTYRRERVLLYGDSLYTLVVSDGLPVISGDNINRMFETFKFNRPSPPNHILKSKSRELLEDISSRDSATAATANAYLESANFEKSDLSLLHETLLRPGLGLSSGAESSDIQTRIVKRILALADSGSFRFAIEHFSQVPDSLPNVKNSLLWIMSSFPSYENYRQMIGKLLEAPPRGYLSDSFIDSLTQNATLTATFIPQLLQLMKNHDLQGSIIALCADLLDSNKVDRGMLLPYESNFIEYAENKRKNETEDNYHYDPLSEGLITLLGRLRTANCNNELKKWLGTSKDKIRIDNRVRIEVIRYLLRNKQRVSSSVFQEIASDKSFRIELHDVLKEEHSLASFPAEYNTKRFFSESLVYSVAIQDDDFDNLKYIGIRNFIFRGKTSWFYFYKAIYRNGDDRRLRLACAGPYDSKTLSPNPPEADVQIQNEEEFSEKNQEKQMAALVKKMEGQN